ncbi:MAG: NAD-dependent epimerase/dehydratase family protein [Flavobacteriaceae bacterium]|nr:NAD-dependent epimerase/dehydratase family protein [Flavobacteriaceae bacterium]
MLLLRISNVLTTPAIYKLYSKKRTFENPKNLNAQLLHPKPNILVTGGTGLVGSHLLAQLGLHGHTIRAIRRSTSSLEAVKKVFSYYTDDFQALFEKIEWVEADLCDLPALTPAFEGITQVYHCAAIVSFKKSDYEAMRKTNIEGTAHLVNLALDFHVEKFCYVSSIATMDKNPNIAVIDEQNEWNPEHNNYGYAITKYGGEMEVWRGTQEGLNVVIVNPGVILGSGFWEHNTGKFFSNAAKGFKFYTMGETGFVGVNDVAKAMIQLMASDLVNERYILVSENKSFQYVLSSIAQAIGVSIPKIKITPFWSEIAWRLAAVYSFITGKPALITKQSARASHHKFTYISQKIKDELGFEFEPLEKTIQRTAKDFLK